MAFNFCSFCRFSFRPEFYALWEPFVYVTNGVLKLIVLIYLSWFSLSSFVVCHRYSARETHVQQKNIYRKKSASVHNQFQWIRMHDSNKSNQFLSSVYVWLFFFSSHSSFIHIVWVLTLLKLFVSTNLFKLGIPCMHFLNRFFVFPFCSFLLLFLFSSMLPHSSVCSLPGRSHTSSLTGVTTTENKISINESFAFQIAYANCDQSNRNKHNDWKELENDYKRKGLWEMRYTS